MKFIARIPIRSRLLALLAFSVTFLWLLGGFSSFTILRLSGLATGMIDHEFETVRTVGAVQAAIRDARGFEKDVLLTMGDDQETDKDTRLWAAEIQKAHAGIAALQAHANAPDGVLIQAMSQGVDAYERGFKEVLEKIAHGELHDPWAANTAMAPVVNRLHQLDQSLGDLTRQTTEQANAKRVQLQRAGQMHPWLVLGVTAIVSLLALVFSLATVRSILRPLKSLQATTSAWGSGDLSGTMVPVGRNEIAQVMQDLAAMHQQLAQLVTQVQAGVRVVNTTPMKSLVPMSSFRSAPSKPRFPCKKLPRQSRSCRWP